MEKLVYVYYACLAAVLIGLPLIGWLAFTAIQDGSAVRGLIAVIVALLIWRPVFAILGPR